jgi:hypothetical protein
MVLLAATITFTTVGVAFASVAGNQEVDPAAGKFQLKRTLPNSITCVSDDGVPLQSDFGAWKGPIFDANPAIHDWDLTGKATFKGQITVNQSTGDGWGSFSVQVIGSTGISYKGRALVSTKFVSPDTHVRGVIEARIKNGSVFTGDYLVANFEATMSGPTLSPMIGDFGNTTGGFASIDNSVETAELTC